MTVFETKVISPSYTSHNPLTYVMVIWLKSQKGATIQLDAAAETTIIHGHRLWALGFLVYNVEFEA